MSWGVLVLHLLLLLLLLLLGLLYRIISYHQYKQCINSFFWVLLVGECFYRIRWIGAVIYSAVFLCLGFWWCTEQYSVIIIITYIYRFFLVYSFHYWYGRLYVCSCFNHHKFGFYWLVNTLHLASINFRRFFISFAE